LPLLEAADILKPVFHDQKAICVADSANESGAAALKFDAPDGTLQALSYLAVPVISRSGQVLGGLFLAHPDAGAFSVPSKRLAGAFAAELRAAVEVISKGIDVSLPHLEESQVLDTTNAIQKDIPEALEYIDSAVNRMGHLTSAVLKLSRLERRDLNVEVVDMNVLVQNTLNSLAHQIKAEHVKVTVAPLPTVLADRLAMEQIIGNLLSNAVLYLTPGRPGEIEIMGEQGQDEVTFHVRDNGRGIAADDRHKVFEPFRRAGKANVPGEGMGLAYVQALVRRHGGRIWYTSEPGVGSTFSFMIVNNFAKENDDGKR
jgi:signal transduction histidine kinase